MGFLCLREKTKHEQEIGNSSEATPRGFGAHGDGGAQEQRTLHMSNGGV